MAKVRGKGYNAFVTRFRKEIVPQIIDFFFAQEDKPKMDMTADTLKRELASPGQFLSDDLYTIITYYYNCAILLIRPKGADGIRLGALIGVNTDATYGISNSAGVHFETLRIAGENTYRLTDAQAKCLSNSYSQLSGTTSKVDVTRFKEMDEVIKIAKPGADGAMVYDEAAMLSATNEPGDITRVYMGIRGEGYDETKTTHVRKLQEMIGRLRKNAAERHMFQNLRLLAQSQKLVERIEAVQAGIVDDINDEEDVAKKETEVAEFVTRLTAEQKIEAKAKAAAEAKKAKPAGKKGGRRTKKLRRA
jgi:hypothetical protein